MTKLSFPKRQSVTHAFGTGSCVLPGYAVLIFASFVVSSYPRHTHARISEMLDNPETRVLPSTGAVQRLADGARLRCPTQDLYADISPEGMRIVSRSKSEGEGDCRISAVRAERVDGISRILSAGKVQVEKNLVRLKRDGLTEEFSTSTEGIRQDFVIPQPLEGEGTLCVWLALRGASARETARGVELTLHCGRKLLYGRLKVTDAGDRVLPAAFHAEKSRIRIVVDDAGATYPVRIDPTVSDADWNALSEATGPGDADVILHGGKSPLTGRDVFYIGGLFETIGDKTVNNIAKWDGAAWHPLGTGTNGRVQALVLDSEGNLYAGGNFQTAGGIRSTNIAKWNGTAWEAVESVFGGTTTTNYHYIRALCFDDAGNLYAGGKFGSNTSGGISNIARWDGDSWHTLGDGLNGVVYDLDWNGGEIVAGGAFTWSGTVLIRSIGTWNGARWEELGGGLNTTACVYSVLCMGSSVVVAGKFNYESQNVKKWDGANWSDLDGGLPGSVNDLVNDPISSSAFFAAGQFIKDLSDGGFLWNVARWTGFVWEPVTPSIGSETDTVKGLATDGGGNLYAAGSFSATLGASVQLPGIGRWDRTAWNPIAISTDNMINAIVTHDDEVYVGGSFSHAGNIAANSVARWDGSSWHKLGDGMNGPVSALAITSSGRLYAGGDFSEAGSVSAANIAGWNGSAWEALAPGTNGPVYALAADKSGNLYAGGAFTVIGIMGVNHITRWDGTGWHTMNLGTNRPVMALAVDGKDQLYVGGSFTSVNGVAANHVAMYDGSWHTLGEGVDGSLFALAVDSLDRVYAGGSFTTAGGNPASSIARWDEHGWGALGEGVNGSVMSLAVDPGMTVYAGGTFLAGGGTAANIANWDGTTWHAMGSLLGQCDALALNRNGVLYAAGGFSRDTDVAYQRIAACELPDPGIALPVSPGDGATDVSITPELSWIHSDNALYFQVQVATQSDFAGDALVVDSSTAETALSIGPLQENTLYFWRIRTRGSYKGSWSGHTSFRTVSHRPDTPILISPAEGDTVDNPVLLTWRQVADADDYHIRVSLSHPDAPEVLDLGEIADTTVSLGALFPGRRYYLSIRARNSHGYSDPPFSSGFHVASASPQLLRPADYRDDVTVSPVFTWNAIPRAHQYHIEMSSDSAFSSPLIRDTVSDTSFSSDPLPYGTTLRWRVRAVYAIASDVYTDWSAASRFTTEKRQQTITFTLPADTVIYGDDARALSATASSTLAVQYSVLSGPGAISGDSLYVTGAGSIVVAANQPGNGEYDAAAEVRDTLTVRKRPITVAARDASKSYGEDDPVLLWDLDGTLVGSDTISGSPERETGEEVGVYAIGRGSLGAGDHYTLSFEPAQFTITRATPTISRWPAASTVTKGKPLSSAELAEGSADVPGTFSFANLDSVPPETGVFPFTVVFAPDDDAHYAAVEGAVEVTVATATRVVYDRPVETPELRVGIYARRNPIALSERWFEFFVVSPEPARVSVTVYDATGNIIDRQDGYASLDGRSGAFRWDLRNREGKKVACGTYLLFASVTTHDGRREKLTLRVGVRQ